MELELTASNGTHQVSELRLTCEPVPEGRIESARFILYIEKPKTTDEGESATAEEAVAAQERRHVSLPTDVVFIDETSTDDVDAEIRLTEDSDITEEELSELLCSGFWTPVEMEEENLRDRQSMSFTKYADTGAEATIKSPEHARRTAILRGAYDAVGNELKIGEAVTVARVSDDRMDIKLTEAGNGGDS